MSRGGVQGFQCDRLSQMLAARRLTQAQLASLVGVSPATVSKWRAGTQAPEREALDRLAGVVNVTPEWFTRPPAEKGAGFSVPLGHDGSPPSDPQLPRLVTARHQHL